MKTGKAALLVMAGALWLPSSLYALTGDRQQPIHIEADSVVLDDAAGTALYRGNVHYSQGTTHFKADKVVVYSAGHEKVDKVIADGSPATFRQQPDNQPEEVRGRAGHIEYYADNERVILEQDAHLYQGKSEFSGSRIEYNIAEETVKAARSENDQDRVQVIIQPRTTPDDQAPAQ